MGGGWRWNEGLGSQWEMAGEGVKVWVVSGRWRRESEGLGSQWEVAGDGVKVWVVSGRWFLTKTHPNSIKTILGLNIQGGNSVKSMLFYPGFVEQYPC